MSKPTPEPAWKRPPAISSRLATRMLVYEQAGSTNDHALRLGEGALVLADRQTAGRGRHGRSWHSPGGVGLWFSLGFDGHVDGLQMAAALAVRDTVAQYIPAATIKWPNDILIGGKKVCGILIEHKHGHTALGIGINVLHRLEDFPEELRGKATSLALASGHVMARADVLQGVLDRLDENVLALRSGRYAELHQRWVDAMGVTGKKIRSGAIEGIVTGVDTRGALIVETNGGDARLISGDIEFMEDDNPCCS